MLPPSYYFTDPEVRPFFFQKDIDLLAADTPIVATGRWMVCEVAPPRGQMYIVKAVVPYAMERINVGTPVESARFIQPIDGNGWFSFEPLLNGNSAIQVEADLVTKRNAAGPLSHFDRWRAGGFAFISNSPKNDADTMACNSAYAIVVHAEKKFQVVFSLAQVAAAGGISQPYTIGVAAPKRVDFAGAVVAGVSMSEQGYQQMVNELQKRAR